MRFCVNYRKLSRVMKKNVFPMPLITDTLDYLSGTNVYSTLDMKAGYWQIELHPSAREKSAFVTHNGLYEFLVVFWSHEFWSKFPNSYGPYLERIEAYI